MPVDVRRWAAIKFAILFCNVFAPYKLCVKFARECVVTNLVAKQTLCP